MTNSEGQLTQQQQLKLAAINSIKKILMDIEQVKHYASRAVLNLSLEVVPEQIEIAYIAIRVRLDSAVKASKESLATYSEYAENIEHGNEDKPKTHRLRP
jgi:hypothetical protein